MYFYRPLFASYGRNFHFDPYGFYSFGNIHVGDDVSVGMRPILLSAKSTITIGNKVMFGPEVVLIGGGHNTSVVGRFMYDVKESGPETIPALSSRTMCGLGKGDHSSRRHRGPRFHCRRWCDRQTQRSSL